MPDQYLTILCIVLFVIAATFLAALFLLIYSFFQIKKAATALTDFLTETDLKINPVLKEAEETLKSIRTVSDDIGSVTSSVKIISETISDLAFKIQTLGLLTDGIQNQLSFKLSALKAGIKAATSVLLNQENKNKGGS